jgi:hypothetical protein
VQTLSVNKDAITPDVIALTIRRQTVAVDLTTATGATIEVIDERGYQRIWSTTFTSQTVDSVRIQHVFEARDVDRIGTFLCCVYIATPSGRVRSQRFQLKVI